MKIYGFFNSMNENGDAIAVAIDETGTELAAHFSSNEAWAINDLGMDGHSTQKHDLYNAAHPGGWETEFVRIRDDRDAHAGLQEALRLNAEKALTASEPA